MIKQKVIYIQYPDDDIEVASFANVFESTPSGSIITGGFYTETDIDGVMSYDDALPINYITMQWQGSKLTLPFSQFKLLTNIVIELDSNTLPDVIITGEPTPIENENNNAILYLLLGLLALKTFSK